MRHMKKRVLIPVCVLFILLLAGCRQAEEQTFRFHAVILEKTDDSVLVAACEGEDIRRSSDQITFSLGGLADVGAEVGDKVNVICTGRVMESYPAQVHAISWSLLEKNTPVVVSAAPFDMRETTIAEYSDETASMRVTLPKGWSYSIFADGTEGTDAGDGAEPTDIFGIKFWLEENPALSLTLQYHTQGVGVCGTGVTFREMQFSGGLTATACTEQIGDDYWFFLMYHEPYNGYAVSYMASLPLWNEFQDEIIAILDTVMLESAHVQ